MATTLSSSPTSLEPTPNDSQMAFVVNPDSTPPAEARPRGVTSCRRALGSDERDNFIGLRIIRDERKDRVLNSLGITTTAEDELEIRAAEATATTLVKALGQDRILPTERSPVSATTFTTTARDVTLRRTESLLVQAYLASLSSGATARRISCRTGLTDLYVTQDGHADLIEAKSSNAHPYVRQALGQILDYAHNVTKPVTTLSTLFPARPSDDDLQLLHRYGVDCIFRSTAGAFVREVVPEERRAVWSRTETSRRTGRRPES